MGDYKLCCFQTGMFGDSRENLLAEVRKQLTRARDEGGKLVIYPQFWALNLVCPEEPADGIKLLKYLQKQGKTVRQTFLDTCGKLAGEFGLYLLPGSLLEVTDISSTETYDSIRFQNRAFLFSPQGQVILEQAQTHFSSWEEELLFGSVAPGNPYCTSGECPDPPNLSLHQGYTWPVKLCLEPGDSLQVVNTPLGVLGLVLGTDAWYPEVSRILSLQGAQVLLALTARPQPYNPWRQVAGMWQQVQQNQVYCAEACLVGNFLGKSFAGQSSLYGPCEITPGETGVLSQAESATEPEKVEARIALATLGEIRSRYPLREHFNIPLYRRELGRVYSFEPEDKSILCVE